MHRELALVTGGSKGIGYGIAQALAKRGIDLILVARNEADLQSAQASLQQHEVRVETIAADLTTADAYDKLSRHLQEHHGKLDILVNNAGDFKEIPSTRDGRLRDKPSELFADVHNLLDINAAAPAVLVYALRPFMLQAAHPKQLDVLSSAAIRIYGGNGVYGPTKSFHERVSLNTTVDTDGRIKTYRIYPSNTDTRIVSHFNFPKLTPQEVGEQAVDMLLSGAATDRYVQQGEDGIEIASFKIDYEAYRTSAGFDGVRLAYNHRELVNRHFVPLLK
jgi:short-subunit dehydrogenase